MNVLYSTFIEKKIDRSKFEGLVFNYLVNNQTKIIARYWRHDEYEEFVSWFYPRLNKAIDTYKETGSSFEAYLTSIVRTAAKEYRLRTTINEVTEHSAWNAQMHDFFAREETPVYLIDKPVNEITQTLLQIRGRKNSKQLLALILKCYFYISEEFIDKITAHTGFDRNILKEMIDKLRIIREKREDKIYRMKERVYGQFYRCIVYENRLSYISENTAAYIKLKLRLEKARNRLEKMRKRIVQVKTYPSNREIAGVIGVTKGSIDSSLFKLKARLNDIFNKSVIDKSILN